MNLRIDLDKGYDIEIKNKAIKNLGPYLRKNYKNSKILIISDDLVYSLHKDKILSEIKGFSYKEYILDQGEESKNTQNLVNILEFLAKNEFKRSDLILAFGGGMVGDISGLCASLYLRGIDFINIPTTFLSAIDSSVGGKTAVNLKAGKNLCGAFYHPRKVFIDTDFLKTLTDYNFNDGLAEAIKYGMIRDKDLLDIFINEKVDKDYENLDRIIKSCLEIKKDIVSKDEKDKGLRQLLNYGHSFGHTFEIISNFKLGHGHAVALGMLVMVNYFINNFSHDFINLLKKYNLYQEIDFPVDRVVKLARLDKKSSKDLINIIAVKKIGHGEIVSTNLKNLRTIYEKSYNKTL